MTQASARTPWNSGLPALIQHWLEAGVCALIELVRNHLQAQRADTPQRLGARVRSTDIANGHPGSAKRNPGSNPQPSEHGDRYPAQPQAMPAQREMTRSEPYRPVPGPHNPHRHP